jgi:hypothetical protein
VDGFSAGRCSPRQQERRDDYGGDRLESGGCYGEADRGDVVVVGFHSRANRRTSVMWAGSPYTTSFVIEPVRSSQSPLASGSSASARGLAMLAKYWLETVASAAFVAT